MRTCFLLPPLLLGLVACSAPAESEAPATLAPISADADAIAVSVMDFMIQPSDLEVAGPTITIAVTNDGPTPHNLTVRDEGGEAVMGTEDLSVRDTATVTGQLEPGDYTIFCSLSGHESLGMSGTLTVTAP